MIVKEQDLTGKQIGNYKIMGKLGRGGMATVYQAHELSLNRMVALKILSPQLSEDVEYIKRFHREAQAAAQLNHPNIVQIYAIGEEKGVHYFAMEYIKGTTLADIRKAEGTLAPARAVSIIKQVAEALGEAHKVGLIHRDVKPSNIMLDPVSGRAKVTDFGIAYVAEAKTKLTREGSIIGTPEYLSPEQCEGRTVDARSDIYSLGVTLYELLSGKTPYEADTPVSMLVKIIKGNFPPLGELNPNLPEPLQKVVEKMMRTDPKARYADAGELIKALNAVELILDQPGLPAQAAAPEQPENLPEAELEPVTASIEQHYPQKQKKSGVWAAVTVAAIILLLLGGAFAAKVFYFDKKAKESAVTPAAETTTASAAESSTAAEASDTAQGTEAASDAEGDQGTMDESTTAEETTTGAEDQAVSADAAGTGSEPDIPPSVSAIRTPEATTPPLTDSTSQTAPATSAASTTPASSQAPNQAVVKKRLPAADSLLVTVIGDEDNADMISAYVESVFSHADFSVIDGPSVGNKEAGDVARYHLVVTVRPMGTTTLNYYGKSTEQYTIGLTMKAVDTVSKKVAAGPFTATVKYTSINAQENIKGAVERMALKVQNAIKN